MDAMNPCEIFLVDDDPVVRRGIRELITRSPGLRVVGEAGSAHQAFDAIVSVSPDIVAVDLSMSGSVTGYELTTRLKASMPELLVLVVSVYKGGFYVERAWQAAADGYVSKDQAEDQLIAAIGALQDGRTFFRSSGPEKPGGA